MAWKKWRDKFTGRYLLLLYKHNNESTPPWIQLALKTIQTVSVAHKHHHSYGQKQHTSQSKQQCQYHDSGLFTDSTQLYINGDCNLRGVVGRGRNTLGSSLWGTGTSGTLWGMGPTRATSSSSFHLFRLQMPWNSKCTWPRARASWRLRYNTLQKHNQQWIENSHYIG